jgi:hypothetical protein
VTTARPESSWPERHGQGCHRSAPELRSRLHLPLILRGDVNNAILAAAGYDFRRLICWLRLLLRQILSALLAEPQSSLKSGFFTDDEIATNWVKRP